MEFLDKFSQEAVRLLRQNPEWKSEADQIARQLTEAPLLLSSPELSTPSQFVADVLENNPQIYENSALIQLYERNQIPVAENAADLVSWLLPAES